MSNDTPKQAVLGGDTPLTDEVIRNCPADLFDAFPVLGTHARQLELQNRKLSDACRIALWIRDRLEERGSFGAGFEEWDDITAALSPPNDAKLSHAGRKSGNSTQPKEQNAKS